MPDLRLLIQLWPIKHSYLVRGSSGMRSIGDLRGRRVVTDLSANAFLGPYHRSILATAGLGEGDVEPVNTGGLPDGLRLLTQGRADATPAAIDLALVRQAHSTISGGVRYLSLGTLDPDAPRTCSPRRRARRSSRPTCRFLITLAPLLTIATRAFGRMHTKPGKMPSWPYRTNILEETTMPARQRIKAADIPEHKNPFPAAVKVGNVVFSSAIGGDDPETHELPPDKEAQIENVFRTIRNIMREAGGSPANIGKVSVYLGDRDDRKLVNPHWVEMFPDEDDRPVRHTTAATMPPGRHIQIEFIAVL